MKKDAAFYFNRAREKNLTGDFEGGAADLDEAIRLDPTNVEYLSVRAEIYYEADKHQQAIPDFTEILELSSDFDIQEDVHWRRRASYSHVGEHEMAITDINWLISYGNTAKELWHKRDSLYYSRAYHKEKLGRFEDAIQDLTTALSHSEKQNHILNRRASIYYRIKEYTKAIQDLNQIINSGKEHPKYLVNLYHLRGIAHYKNSNLTTALDDFNQATRLRGDNPFTDVVDYMERYCPEEL